MSDGVCYSYSAKEISIKLFIIKINKSQKKFKLTNDDTVHVDVKIIIFLVNYIETALGLSGLLFFFFFSTLLYTSKREIYNCLVLLRAREPQFDGHSNIN